MIDLHEHLTANGVKLSIRKGVHRMPLGLYNDASDVDRILALVRAWADARGGAA